MVKMYLMPLGCVHEVVNFINFEKWSNEQYTRVGGSYHEPHSAVTK